MKLVEMLMSLVMRENCAQESRRLRTHGGTISLPVTSAHRLWRNLTPRTKLLKLRKRLQRKMMNESFD